MDDALGHEITQLLQAWRRGDEGALDKLTPQVYRELHRIAVEETAEVLKVSPETVARDGRLAKAWLMRALSENKSDEA